MKLEVRNPLASVFPTPLQPAEAPNCRHPPPVEKTEKSQICSLSLPLSVGLYLWGCNSGFMHRESPLQIVASPSTHRT
ncbi:hypothetical protein SLA2020_009960 [Shorea laevis]